jgi:hypothetical protein
MAVRTGMQSLISTVRGYANAGTAEWTVTTDTGILTYWSDQELQNALDRHKVEYIHAPMQSVQSYSGGSVVYLQYRTNVPDIESGTAVFKVEDVSGTVTPASVDYARGVATFATDQAGKALYWSGYAYDLNAAAADIWRVKASHAAELVDWSTDGHNVKRSQQVKAFQEMAAFYQARSGTEGVTTAKIVRDDL